MPCPLALTTTVMDAADWRCQCPGDCGTRHETAAAMCLVQHDEFVKGRYVRLVAAPADLSLSLREAVALPPTDLRAWCPRCHAGRLRQIRIAAEKAADALPQADTLF